MQITAIWMMILIGNQHPESMQRQPLTVVTTLTFGPLCPYAGIELEYALVVCSGNLPLSFIEMRL